MLKCRPEKTLQDDTFLRDCFISDDDNYNIPSPFYNIEYDLLINLLKFSPLNKFDCNKDKSIICFTIS